MIKVNLEKLMEINNLNINQLAKVTGLSRKAITLLANYNDEDDKPVSIQYKTIDVLCSFFNVGIDDLIQYVYNENDFYVAPMAFNAGRNNDITILLYYYRKKINGNGIINYFLVAVKLDEIIKGEGKKYKTPSKLFDNEIEKEFEERIIEFPTSKKFSFEIIDFYDIEKTFRYIKNHPLFSLIKDKDMIALNNFEITTIMKSFSKAFLAKITALSFEQIIDSTDTDEIISINWNFGEYSWHNSGKFHFEYSKIKNTIISMDDDDVYNAIEKFGEHNSDILGKIDNRHVKPNTHSL